MERRKNLDTLARCSVFVSFLSDPPTLHCMFVSLLVAPVIWSHLLCQCCPAVQGLAVMDRDAWPEVIQWQQSSIW